MRSVVVGVSAAVLLAALGGVCVVLRVESKLKEARAVVSRAGDVAFTMGSWTGPAHAAGFEPVAVANRYTTGAMFGAKVYLAGPSGLAVYGVTGEPVRTLRAGIEVPPAAIVAMASGHLRGRAGVELFAATAGEGLLIVSGDAPQTVEQMRPKEAEARDVTAVFPLESGEVLLGTRRGGLLVFDGSKLRMFAPQFAGVSVTALVGDEGDFWVGTRTQGVLHWHAGTMEAIGVSDGLPDAMVNDIAVGEHGVFVGTPRGVAEIRDGHVERVLGRGLFAQAVDVEGDTLQVATIDQGVHSIALKARGGVEGGERGSEGAEALRVTHFLPAGAGLMAVAGDRLMQHVQGGTWQTVIEPAKQTLADGNVTALSFAPDGRLWIGYFDRGVDVLDVAGGRAQHVEDDHVFCVNRIVVDRQRGTMDVATANGLVLFDGAAQTPQEKQVLLRRDGLISDQVTDVAFSGSGMTLATPAGLTMMTAGGPQSLYSFQGLANNHVYALAAEPGSARVMAGTLAGVSIVDDGAVRQNVTLKNSGLKRNWITAIARVSDEGWFVGTYGGGVVAMDAKGDVTPMEGMAVKAVINPNAMLVTERHVLAGSLDDGLLVYDRGSRRWTQVTAGLPSRNVTAFAERGGEVYVGTENGIVRIAETELP